MSLLNIVMDLVAHSSTCFWVFFQRKLDDNDFFFFFLEALEDSHEIPEVSLLERPSLSTSRVARRAALCCSISSTSSA